MSRRLKRWVIGGGAAVLVTGAAVVFLVHWTAGSSEGSVHVGTATVQTAPVQAPLAIKTTYFSTVLPAGFRLQRQTETPNAAMVQLQLLAYSGSTTDRQFAATVGVMPAEGLRGIGDYNLRMSDPATYSSFVPPSLPAGATAFQTASGPAGFVVFWPHGARYAELALSTDGGANLVQLETVFSEVMHNWAWQ